MQSIAMCGPPTGPRRLGPVGTALSGRPPDRTRRADFPHRAPTSSQTSTLGRDGVPAGAEPPASVAYVGFENVVLSPHEVSTTWLLLAASLPSIDSTGVTLVFADFLQVGTTDASDSSQDCCGL